MRKEYFSPEAVSVSLYDCGAILFENSDQGDHAESIDNPIEVGEDDLDDLIKELDKKK